jgi:ribosome biogenesis GTPase
VYSLQDLGWSPFFQQQITGEARSLFPARVSGHAHGIYRLACERPGATGELTATIAGRLAFETDGGATVPAVGDWVMARAASDGEGVIERVLDRPTKLSRIAPGWCGRSALYSHSQRPLSFWKSLVALSEVGA